MATLPAYPFCLYAGVSFVLFALMHNGNMHTASTMISVLMLFMVFCLSESCLGDYGTVEVVELDTPETSVPDFESV